MKYKILAKGVLDVEFTPEESILFKPYLGLYFLRDGDLHSERIDKFSLMRYQYTDTFLDKLWINGLLFKTLEDAEKARECMLKALHNNLTVKL